MHLRFTLLAAVLGLALLAFSPLRAAEMPTADDLQAQMGTPAETITVYELHLSVGDDLVAVDYVGYEASRSDSFSFCPHSSAAVHESRIANSPPQPKRAPVVSLLPGVSQAHRCIG